MALVHRRLANIWSGLRGGGSGRAESCIWAELLADADQAEIWRAARATTDSPRVLVATSVGGFRREMAVESSLAVALTLRGARVEFLLCDAVLPACQATKISLVTPEALLARPSQPRCDSCQAGGGRTLAPLGLTCHRYGQCIRPEDRVRARAMARTTRLEAIARLREDGIAIGEHALAGALRFYARGDLQGEPHGEAILRRYLEASMLSARAMDNLLERRSYDAVVFHHGIYVPQGLIGEVCRRRGTRVVNWNPAYRRHCFVFSEGDTYHHTMISEPVETWQDLPWSPALEEKLLDYLQSRWHGTRDWIWFHDAPEEDPARIEAETGIDFDKPVISLLTSVMWDAQLHYESNAFSSMLEWVRFTIEHFGDRPDLQLVIRIHPAEVRGAIPSRQRIIDEIRRAFPTLPDNVFVVAPESRVSTYALCERSDAVLIYNTKTGIEVSSMGIPVVVAGEAWIRNKGFTLDATSPSDYAKILSQLPFGRALDADSLLRARRYAFHFFFRRMIELPFVVAGDRDHDFDLEIANISALKPGHYSGLDVICEGILDEKPFVFAAESELDTNTLVASV